MAILEISVTKGAGTVSIDTDAIPVDVYSEALRLGLKEMVNRGMSKITVKGLEGEKLDEARAAAMTKAAENVEAINSGKVRMGTGAAKKSKESGKVMTEARRLARNIVKDELRKAGHKVSHYAASDITAAANQLIEADPSIVEQAKANLEARETAPVKIDVAGLLKESPKLVKAAEERKAAAKDQLSAKQAGLVAKKAKPGTAAHALN